MTPKTQTSRPIRSALLLTLCLAAAANVMPCTAQTVRRLPVSEYRDRMKAGWIGQIAGVAWGAPTEFRWKDAIIPEEDMPAWQPGMINNAFGQDDLYVEMTFLRTLEQYGLGCSIRQAGIDFAQSGYPLWCANNAGRTNLRKGIAPPDSGHPRFNACPNDIDYQIEADYSGLIAPGLPQAAVDLGETFGRLMNYGDGVYAGQFVGAMVAAAFFERDLVRVVEQALQAIPAESQYAEMVRDMLAWFRADPNDWQATWRRCQQKYREDPAYQKASNGGIDCKINGAYVLMGLLYGKGDPDQTIRIACRCGHDSDCNPSSAAGVLFTTIGFANLPAHFTRDLDATRVFSHTSYSFTQLLDVCEMLARQVVTAHGGTIEKDADGNEVFVIPQSVTRPSPLLLSWAPGPIAESRFTAAERALITAANVPNHMPAAVAAFAPGWEISDCGPDMEPGLREHWGGRNNVLMVHPLDPQTGCVLTRKIDVPAAGKTSLKLAVAHDPRGDFDLVVKIDGEPVLTQAVGPDTTLDHWLDKTIDLTPHAGATITVELINQPSGWRFEAAYWADISVVTE